MSSIEGDEGLGTRLATGHISGTVSGDPQKAL